MFYASLCPGFLSRGTVCARRPCCAGSISPSGLCRGPAVPGGAGSLCALPAEQRLRETCTSRCLLPLRHRNSSGTCGNRELQGAHDGSCELGLDSVSVLGSASSTSHQQLVGASQGLGFTDATQHIRPFVPGWIWIISDVTQWEAPDFTSHSSPETPAVPLR